MRFGLLEGVLIFGIILLIFGPKRFAQIKDSFIEGIKEFTNSSKERKE